jgi:hypothetical protein
MEIFESKVQNKKFRVVRMQKYRIIGANFQSSGCAGAHPRKALDPPLMDALICQSYHFMRDMWLDGYENEMYDTTTLFQFIFFISTDLISCFFFLVFVTCQNVSAT